MLLFNACSAVSLHVLVCTNSRIQAERFSDGVFFRLKIIMVFELITARPGYHYDYSRTLFDQ